MLGLVGNWKLGFRVFLLLFYSTFELLRNSILKNTYFKAKNGNYVYNFIDKRSIPYIL
jgi:hypothetical protein